MQITPQNVSKAINVSFSKFDHFRKGRGRFMTQMVGRFYSKINNGNKDDRKAQPLNFMYSGVTTLVPNLVYNDPKVKIRTDILAYRDYADTLELAVNHLHRRIDLRMTLRKAIVDSIFMAGFIKTGLASGDSFITMDGVDVEIGQPYAERVDPDDIVLDPMARDWDEQAFIGNRFRANLDDLIATGLYEPDLLEKLASRTETEDSKGLAAKLTGAMPESEMADIQRYVDLVEVYLPREKIVVTLPYQKNATEDKFLRVADYQGPDRGPYHMLGYAYVPDNILPIPPASIWYDLHVMGNRIARKLSRQSERIKRVLAYESSAVEDVNEIAEADDGETVRVDDISKIKEVQYGGAGKESYDWMEWTQQRFSEQAGNIDMLSGSGSNTPTATQAEMLQANTSVRLGDMQNQVYNFAAEVAQDLTFFVHTDPLIDLPLVRRRDGAEQQVVYTPEMRQGEWLDYNIKVQPYSMARPDPNMAVRRKLEFATNVIPAASQAAMMLGPGFKIGAFLQRMALEVGIEDADEWLNTVEMQMHIMQQLQMAQMTGDAGKANGMLKQPMGMGGSFNPQQPNPGQMGPTGGISPGTERAQAQQETAGELQGSRQPSANSLAQAQA
jgi:hypothetical protein